MSILNYLSSIKNPDTIAISNYIQKIAGDTYNSANTPLWGHIYGPDIVYHNGCTYFTWNKQLQLSLNNFYVAKYDSSDSSIQITEITVTSNYDYHNHPCISVDSSGYIWAIYENHTTTCNIFKSDAAEDISSFSEISYTGIAGRHDYPKFYAKNGKYILIYRDYVGGDKYPLKCAISTDGVSYTTYSLTEITVFPVGGTNIRHYPFFVFNALNDNWLHVMFWKRTFFTSDFSYHERYSMKTPTDANMGKVWYNDAETFNQDISISGQLTEAQLNTNYRVFTDATYDRTNTGGSWTSNVLNELQYHNIEQFDTGIVRASDMTSFTNEVGGQIFTNYNDEWYRFKNPSGLRRFDLQGNLFDFTAAPYPGQGGSLRLPVNMSDIAKNQKFALIQTDIKGGTDTVLDTIKADIYVHEAQFQ